MPGILGQEGRAKRAVILELARGCRQAGRRGRVRWVGRGRGCEEAGRDGGLCVLSASNGRQRRI